MPHGNAICLQSLTAKYMALKRSFHRSFVTILCELVFGVSITLTSNFHPLLEYMIDHYWGWFN